MALLQKNHKQLLTPEQQVSNFAISIFTVNGLLMQNGDRLTKELGQSSARWQVLGRANHRTQTVAAMATDIGHARQSVQRVADALASEGLVEYINNPHDRRAKLVQITPSGAEILSRINSKNAAWAEQIMTSLDPEQLAAITTALQDISLVLESNIQSKLGKIIHRETYSKNN